MNRCALDWSSAHGSAETAGDEGRRFWPVCATCFPFCAPRTGRRWPIHAVSCVTGEGLDALRRKTFDALGVIRVYTKEPGKAADRAAPFTLPRGATVADLALRIHKDVAATMKFARVWGPSAFDGQSVHHDHVLAEGDVVEIHAR